MAGIGLISNPKARQNKRRPRLLRLMQEYHDEVLLSRFTNDLPELDAALDEFHRKKVDIVAVNGGDGTLHLVITKMIQVWGDRPLPPIAVLRGGTINQVATNVKARRGALANLKRLVKKYKDGDEPRIVQKPLFRIDDKYGFIFGNGIVTAFMDYYYEHGDPSPLVAFRTLLNSVGSIVLRTRLYRKLFEGFDAHLVVDGKDLGTKPYLGIFVTSLSQIGLGFEPFWRNRHLTDKMQMLAIHKGGWIVPFLGLAWLGKPLPKSTVLDTIGKHFSIRVGRPFKYTIDGDLYQSAGSLDLFVDRSVDIIAG